jgi:hypothetical protein
MVPRITPFRPPERLVDPIEQTYVAHVVDGPYQRVSSDFPAKTTVRDNSTDVRRTSIRRSSGGHIRDPSALEKRRGQQRITLRSLEVEKHCL